jgi:hypothetical protein
VIDLTLDIQVFRSGASIGAPEHRDASRRLMHLMRETEGAFLVLDDNGAILRKYEEGAGQGFGKQWLTTMLSRRKVLCVKRVRLEKGTRVRLDELKFRGEDRDWIARTAAASESGFLVAHEPHFHAKKVVKILNKKMGVRIVTADECCGHVQRCAECSRHCD